jgi:pimeloyl-ACP methyl ester carboxylesterase
MTRRPLTLLFLFSFAWCGRLADQPPATTLTSTVPEPTDAGGSADAGDSTDAGALDAGQPPGTGSICGAGASGLHDVTGTPAGPYLVHHPTTGRVPKHTVIFLPGGDGSKDLSEEFIWPLWLANGRGVDEVRVVIPYTADGDLGDEQERIVAIAAEVLGCFGGDPAHVHLAGTSMGGLAAFETMKRQPAPFADRKSTRLNSSHNPASRMPSSA